jgi:flagellar assembly protein FliH
MSAVKFTFDTDFDRAPDDARTRERARKSYSPEELDALLTGAREEGRRHGDVLAMQQMAAAMGQIAAAVAGAIQTLDAEFEQMRAEAAALALAAAKKLAGAALSASPETEIFDALRSALHQAIGEPRVVVRTNTTLAQRLEQGAAEIAGHEGYEGRVHFVADPALAGADCRIEWRGGGIERAHSAIESALSDLILRRFTQTRE